MKTRTVNLPPLCLRADLTVAKDGDEDRTVELVFSTGAGVERYDWATGSRYLEKLSLDPAHVRLDRLNAGAPLLDAHSAWSVHDMLGAVVPGSAEIRKKKGFARAQFSKREAVNGVWQDVRDGLVRNVSVGYRVHKFEEDRGKEGSIPVRTATDWEPFEISMVPMGADAGAQTRAREDMPTFPCVIVTRGQEETMPDDPKNPSSETRTAPPPAPPAAPPVAPTAPAPVAPNEQQIREAATQAERSRATEIRQAVRAAGLDAAVAEDLVSRGVSLDEARRDILAKLAVRNAPPTPPAPEPTVVADEQVKWRQGAQASLIHRAALTDVFRQAMKAKPDHPAFKGLALDPGEFRGFSLLDLARESLERAGVKTRGLDKMALAGAAMTHRSGAGSFIGNTTSDFAVALENVLHKTLLAAYTITPDTWRRFCAVGSLTDFKPHPRYRTGSFGRLDTLLESGEFKNKSIPDAAKESITGATKGNIVSLSRQAIVNDDMGVFNRLAFQVGRAAALSIEMDVFDLLALNAGLGPVMSDGQTLFHATHNNITTGAALAVAALDADRVAMASQKDISSNEILDLRPAVLVIAVGLGGEARVLNQAQYEPTDNKFMKPNKVVGLFRDIVDTPRLTGTRRYLFTEPAQMPVIEVAFLEGVQEPFLEAQDGWRIDGVEWKVRLDYGIAAVEFRGAVTNAGV